MKVTPGQAMQAWRIQSKLSQKKAAKRVGVTQSTWCRWEADAVEPSVSQALRIERVSRRAVRVEMWRGFVPSPAASVVTT